MENGIGHEGNNPGLPLRWNLKPNRYVSPPARHAFGDDRRRHRYSLVEKERAIRLLDLGIPCRQVAQLMGPLCSSGTPIRWRLAERRRQEHRGRLAAGVQMRRRH